MASYTGILIDSPHRAEDTLRCSATIQGLSVSPITFPPEEIHSVVPLGVGTLTFVQQGENETAYTGEYVNSFLNDYYYRIHVVPAAFEFGAILNPLEEDVMVWNAWFISKICTTINETNPEEFEWSGLTPPFSLPALGYTYFTLNISDVGSVEFIAALEWVFPGESPEVTMTGTRLRLFPFDPRVPQQESYEWATNILRAKIGTEQRISTRWIPRQGFNFNVYLKNEQEQARLDALLFTWAKRAWGIPLWTEWQKHEATINVDDEVIYFDTDYYDFRDSSYGMIWQGFDAYEVFKILTIDSGGGVTLDAPIRNTWSGTKWIMPLRVGHMFSPSQLRETADGYGEFSCKFIISDNRLISPYVAPVTYLGLPVLPPSIEEDGLDVNIEADMRFMDLDVYRFITYSDSTYNIIGQDHVFRNEGIEECWNFKQFLFYLKGRLNTVWRPTYKHDFVIQEKIGAADQVIKIDAVGWAENMGDNDLRTHVAFVFPDGSLMLREMTGLDTAEGYNSLSIDTALGIEVFPGEAEISLVDLCRLTSDKVNLTWEESFRNICKLNFTKVTQ